MVDNFQDGSQWFLSSNVYALIYFPRLPLGLGLVNSICQRSDRISLLRLGDRLQLPFCMPFLALSAFSCYYVVSYPVERPSWKGTEEDLPANSQQGDLPTTVWVSWELDSSSLEPSDETVVPTNTLPATLRETLIHRNCKIINTDCLKRLNSTVICSVNIDNYYLT